MRSQIFIIGMIGLSFLINQATHRCYGNIESHDKGTYLDISKLYILGVFYDVYYFWRLSYSRVDVENTETGFNETRLK